MKMDEVLFAGKYNDWEYTVNFDLSKASERDVSYALSYIHEGIEDRAFFHSGIDCKMIEKEVPQGNGLQDLIKYIDSRKPGQWKEFLLQAARKEELLPVAEAKLICETQKKFKVPAKVSTTMVQSSLKPGKQELFEGQIAFVGKYKEWAAIKKLGMEDNTQDYEVAGILGSVNTTIVKKAFFFLHPDKELEAIAANATRGKRKSFINLTDAFRQVASSMTGEKIHDAYLLKCVYENLGFAPYANVEILVPAHPDLKVAKPRGRFGKK
ncbi:Uncharacterised protein [uncultured archaeon]|nr:Uncharacterised protein [uncultured archaeon]